MPQLWRGACVRPGSLPHLRSALRAPGTPGEPPAHCRRPRPRRGGCRCRPRLLGSARRRRVRSRQDGAGQLSSQRSGRRWRCADAGSADARRGAAVPVKPRTVATTEAASAPSVVAALEADDHPVPSSSAATRRRPPCRRRRPRRAGTGRAGRRDGRRSPPRRAAGPAGTRAPAGRPRAGPGPGSRPRPRPAAPAG